MNQSLLDMQQKSVDPKAEDPGERACWNLSYLIRLDLCDSFFRLLVSVRHLLLSSLIVGRESRPLTGFIKSRFLEVVS